MRTTQTRSGFSLAAAWNDVAWPSACRSVALRLVLERDEDRADLEPDAARLEERQPRPREDIRLSQPVLSVGELHQQIGVGVRDHARTILSSWP